MLRLLIGGFERSAKANWRSKLLVYPGVISAAALTYQALEKERQKREYMALKKEFFRKLKKAYFDPIYSDDDDDFPLVFPPMNGRSVCQMVCDLEEEEEEKKKEEKLDNKLTEKFSPSEQSGGTKVKYAATKGKRTQAEIDNYLKDERLKLQADLRGMNVPEFLEYARKENKYRREMCAKCKQLPLPPGCDQETVNTYCGR